MKMVKKAILILSVCLLLFGFGLSALAEEASSAAAESKEEVYDTYEDDWFNNGYEGIENDPDLGDSGDAAPRMLRWYRRLSVVPVIIGAVAGAAVVVVLYRKSRPVPPEAVPFELHARAKLTAQNDRLGDVKRTMRNLSAADPEEE